MPYNKAKTVHVHVCLLIKICIEEVKLTNDFSKETYLKGELQQKLVKYA
jgi:hypothetical protein